MRDDYADIDAVPVVENGGGVQVVDETYTVVLSKGLDTLGKTRLSPGEFTEFLMRSRSVGLPYHYDIQYSEPGGLLIVTFHTIRRAGFAQSGISVRDCRSGGALIAVILFIAALALLPSSFRITACVTKPLRMLADGSAPARGRYAVRSFKLKNEFAELRRRSTAWRGSSRRKPRFVKREDEAGDCLESRTTENPLASAAG
jgi:hypothetical protein